MTRPGPSRSARRTIGLSLTTVLAFAAVIRGLIAFVNALSAGSNQP